MILSVINDDNTNMIIDYTPIFNRSDEIAASWAMCLIMFALYVRCPL